MVWMFPGQGSQKVGMGRAFLEEDWARPYLEQANRTVGRDLVQLMREGPAEELTLTQHAQPALFLVGFLAAKFLLDRGWAPEAVLGHSLGELTAYTVAGVWTFGEGMEAVALRGRLMARANEQAPGGMLAVIGAPREALEDVVARSPEPLVMANENAPDQIVLSGTHRAIAYAREVLAGKARRLVPLNVSAAFHSPLMRPAAEAFAEFLSRLPYRKPRFPIVVNPTGEWLEDPEALRESITVQLASPVRFTKMMQTLQGRGIRHFVELGVGKVLCGLVRRNLPEAVCEVVDRPTVPPGWNSER